MTDIGFAVVLLRQAQRMTQRTLARRVRSSRSWVSNIEVGVKQPTVSSVLRLARALGVKPPVLFMIPESRDAALRR